MPRKRKSSTSGGLREWFGQNKGKGGVDCKTGKPCGRKKRTGGKRGYPYCRPTMAQCKSKAAKSAAKRKTSAKKVFLKKRKSGGKKS